MVVQQTVSTDSSSNSLVTAGYDRIDLYHGRRHDSNPSTTGDRVMSVDSCEQMLKTLKYLFTYLTVLLGRRLDD